MTAPLAAVAQSGGHTLALSQLLSSHQLYNTAVPLSPAKYTIKQISTLNFKTFLGHCPIHYTGIESALSLPWHLSHHPPTLSTSPTSGHRVHTWLTAERWYHLVLTAMVSCAW